MKNEGLTGEDILEARWKAGMAIPVPSYVVVSGFSRTAVSGPYIGISCALCGLLSWSPSDAEHLYCTRCKIYHRDVEFFVRLKTLVEPKASGR